jgi:MinD superfamily P-loop ATPase
MNGNHAIGGFVSPGVVGEGECAAICMVGVSETGAEGECIATNGVLCMGCMACVAHCTENGVMVIPNDPGEHLSLNELLK